MINLFKTALIVLLTFAFFYLLGAFYSASFDISRWSIDTRFTIAFFGGFFSALVMVFFGTYGGDE
jgi:hypothetical protein